jgi:hypothetical protein
MLVGVLISAILVMAVAVCSQTNSAYAAQPARIVGTVPIYFDTLQAAFNEANDGNTVEALNIVFPESLSVTKSLTLIGGYENNYSSNPGLTSVQNLTITGGSLEVGNLVIGGRANPPQTITVPGAPTNVMAAVPGNTQVGVTFTAPASDGGSAISGYTVISNPAGGHDSNDGSTALSHIVSGLTNGTAYSFTVKATNAAGTGPASAASNSVTPTIANPTAQFKATAIVSGQGRFNNLILSGTTLFWGDGDSGKGIWKFTKDNTSPQLLVPRLNELSNMVVHGNYAYWINTNLGRTKFSIYRSTLDGSHTTLLTQGNAPFPASYLAADDTALYFTAKEGSSQATSTASVVIQRFPLDGSAPATLYHVADGAAGLATDDSYIYVLDETGADPFAANLVRISKTDGSSQTLAQNIAKVNGAITVANGTIYVGTYGALLKVTTSGGTPTVLISGVEPYFLSVHQDTIYCINFNSNDYDKPCIIQAIPVGGGDVTVVATNLREPSNLLATADGLYWSEPQSNGKMVLKTLPWQSGQVTTVAGGLYIWSLDVSGGSAYLTQNMPDTGFSEISRVSLADGVAHLLYGGVNAMTYTFCATADSLVIGDKSALKKVPINGGITSTLAIDIGFDIKDVKDQSGTVFFTSGGAKSGIYKISDAGGQYVALDQGSGPYSAIVSIQDGYVYYVLSKPNYSGGTTSELRRVRTDGSAPSESYFKVPTQYALVQFDGIETVYLTHWLYNDQYEYLKYDIATGNVVKLFSGTWRFTGVNSFYVFFADYFGNVYRVPTNGGQVTSVIWVPYPLELNTHWVPYGNGFYFIISYRDPNNGYLSQIDYIEQIR